MLSLKKTAVAVLAFGSSAVFAGTMGPVCAPGSVTVPCEKSAWNFGVQALYLQPGFSGDLAWAGSGGEFNTNFVDANSKWQWGFMLEGSYHFNTGNDLNLNWYHLGGSTKTRNNMGADFLPSAALDFDAEDAQFVANPSLSIKPRWDAVNLEFGQHVDFGEMKNIRFHGGVQYVRIKVENGLSAVNNITIDGVVLQNSLVATGTTTYNGFGPRIGADMSYDWGNGLAVYANTAGAFLVGTSKFDASGSESAQAVNQAASFAGSGAGSRTAIVPELEAKLGANYTWAMAQGDLTVDAGYMWVNYFDSQNNSLGSFLGAKTPGSSNFGLSGPYLGLKWVGSVV